MATSDEDVQEGASQSGTLGGGVGHSVTLEGVASQGAVVEERQGRADRWARRIAATPPARFLNHVGDVAAVISGYMAGLGIIAIFSVTIGEVFFRKVLGSSILWSTEVLLFSIASTAFLGLAYTLREEGHVRMTLLYAKLSPRVQRWVDLFVSVIALVWVTYFSVAAWDRLDLARRIHESTKGIIDIQFWIGMMFMVLGAAFLGLVLVSRIVRILAGEQVGRLKSLEEMEQF